MLKAKRAKRCAVIAGGWFVLLVLTQIAWPAPPAPAEPATAPSAVSASPLLARGYEVYAAQCAACHGSAGLGDGPAAYLLYPKPRNFSQSAFRLTSVKSGLPTDDDLLATLKNGMPGSAMPSWAHLPDSDLRALVLTVRDLAIQAKVKQLQANSKTMTAQKATALAHRMLDPGAPIELPPRPDVKALTPERGQLVFAANCVNCHDADGRGRNKRDLLDQSGFPITARDFTRGVFKGGSDDVSLARRIALGMPGSPMPAAPSLSPEDFWSLVTYVQAFIKPGAQERVLQKHSTLIAKRVEGPINSADPRDPVWRNAPASTFIALAPLWWRDERIEGVSISAIHDGSKIAIRMSWDDPTLNELTDRPQAFTDGAAIQFSSAAAPPFFAMGSTHAPVNIWHWKATWQKRADSGKGPDITATYPNMQNDPAPEDFQTATQAGNPAAQAQPPSVVQDLRAEGFGTLTPRGPAQQAVAGGARRTSTGWEVVFMHPLNVSSATNDGDVALELGKTLSIGFAAWDGEVADRNGQKSVSIWHTITIEK
jgi:DMSO reductase family type II enzyme heme b subunit